jgi:hypothetical protein
MTGCLWVFVIAFTLVILFDIFFRFDDLDIQDKDD